jgi:hypothetical protein
MSPVPGAADIERKYQYWIDFGKREQRQSFIELLKNRLCFDHLENNTCEHRECYGNLEIIEILERES